MHPDKRAGKRLPLSPLSKNRRGSTLLIENLIAIILNLVFIAILIFFLISKSGSASVLEEKYAKEIALLIDSSKPGMQISLNVEDAVKAAEEKFGEGNAGNIITITENIVNVNLQGKKGYSYSYFNDIEVTGKYLNMETNEYVLFIGEKNE